MSAELQQALQAVPDKIREAIIKAYMDLKKAVRESKHDLAGLNAGKFCEAVIRSLQDRVFKTYTPFGTAVVNFPNECRRIIEAPNVPGVTESEKTIVPRALSFLYTMRNKRGIGHIGGDISANAVDLSVMAAAADWMICELIRIHHGLSLEEAQQLIDRLAVRRIPDIWDVAGKRRTLKKGLTYSQQTLRLLYDEPENAVKVDELVSWLEYSRRGEYEKRVLAPLHRERFIEWNKSEGTVILSPKGSAEVEANLLS